MNLSVAFTLDCIINFRRDLRNGFPAEMCKNGRRSILQQNLKIKNRIGPSYDVKKSTG